MQGQLYASVDLTVGVDAAATLRQVHDRTDRFTERWTREHTVKMHRKALGAAEVHESLLLGSGGTVSVTSPSAGGPSVSRRSGRRLRGPYFHKIMSSL